MPIRYLSSVDGIQPITLNSLWRNPTVVAERFLSIMAGGPLGSQFVTDQVLRGPIPAPSGAVQFRVSSGLFADQSSEIVNPRAEIPLATMLKGDLQTAATALYALAVSFDWTMRDLDITGELDRQLGVVQNTIVRDIDAIFLTKLLAALSAPVVAASSWATSTTLRAEILQAKLGVASAQAPNASAGSYLGYVADTIIMNPIDDANLVANATFVAMVYGQVNPSFQFSSVKDLPGSIFGLTPLVTPSCPVGTVVVCQRKTIGGYADRLPLQMSELYDWNPARISRADAVRDTVAFIDQPLAGKKITGI